MLYSKSCHFFLFFAYLLSANARRPNTAVRRVNLGTAEKYAILTKSGISTVPQSAITGDIAVSPIAGTAITGFSLTLDPAGDFSKSTQLTGKHKAYAASYLGDTPKLLRVAIKDMKKAYNDAVRRRARPKRTDIGKAGDISGLTLKPGVYTFNSDVTMNLGGVTIKGDADDIFIIQMTGNLKVATNMKVELAGGAQAKNIFWQVAGNVNVLAGAHMEGILLVKTDVTFITGSSLNGRILAQTACVLQMATIVEPEKVKAVENKGKRNLRHH